MGLLPCKPSRFVQILRDFVDQGSVGRVVKSNKEESHWALVQSRLAEVCQCGNSNKAESSVSVELFPVRRVEHGPKHPLLEVNIVVRKVTVLQQ